MKLWLYSVLVIIGSRNSEPGLMVDFRRLVIFISSEYISIFAYLSVEVLLDELLDLGDTSGASDEHDLIDVSLSEVGILHNLLDGLHGGTEQVLEEKRGIKLSHFVLY